jgi:cytochrome c oxidase subunit 4
MDYLFRGKRLCCAVSLCLQIFYADHLVKIEDWSALMDTSHAAAAARAILLSGTVILNLILFAVFRERNAKV